MTPFAPHQSELDKLKALRSPVVQFDKTYCSQCGSEFGPGDSGLSACSEHVQRGARQPLSAKQVVQEFCEQPMPDRYSDAFMNGVRFAERYHGIAGGSQ